MGIFRICFFGLISHIGDEDAEGYTHAAVLKDEDDKHKPRIYFTDDQGEPLSGNVTFDKSDIATGRASFLNDVPSLQDLTGDSAIDAVQDAQPHAFVELYVFYPGGTLRSRERHEEGLLIERGGAIPKHLCVARVVELVVDDDDISTLMINYNGTQRPIGHNECVLIVNAERRTSDKSHEHSLREHRRITRSTDFATITHTAKKCASSPPTNCAWIENVIDPLRFRDATDVECTNTRWP
jgi:hypothetical protein